MFLCCAYMLWGCRQKEQHVNGAAWSGGGMNISPLPADCLHMMQHTWLTGLKILVLVWISCNGVVAVKASATGHQYTQVSTVCSFYPFKLFCLWRPSSSSWARHSVVLAAPILTHADGQYLITATGWLDYRRHGRRYLQQTQGNRRTSCQPDLTHWHDPVKLHSQKLLGMIQNPFSNIPIVNVISSLEDYVSLRLMLFAIWQTGPALLSAYLFFSYLISNFNKKSKEQKTDCLGVKKRKNYF